MEVYTYGEEQADLILLQMTDDREMREIGSEVSLIREMTRIPFQLIACKVDDWNRDLSPWSAPPVFGNESFGGMAEDSLKFLREKVLSRYANKTFIVGGYSLAGLFALWAACETDAFRGVAAASPSVWFPGFTAYAEEHPIRTEAVYLSLGDKEEKTKNPKMASVGEVIRSLHGTYAAREGLQTTLEWNPGNHFKDPGLRTAKAFAWVMDRLSFLL